MGRVWGNGRGLGWYVTFHRRLDSHRPTDLCCLDFLATTIRSTRNYSDYAMGAWAANKKTGIRNFVYSTVHFFASCPPNNLSDTVYCRTRPSTHRHTRFWTSPATGVFTPSAKSGLRFSGLSRSASLASMAMSTFYSRLSRSRTEPSQRAVSTGLRSTPLPAKGSPLFLNMVTLSASSKSRSYSVLCSKI
jgi:hypothetical protein